MRTCLVVDDSRVIRKVSRHILESLDFTVEEAENGKLGTITAEKRNKAKGPTAVVLPLGGVSQIDAPGYSFHDPNASAAYRAALLKKINRKKILGKEVDANINDDVFAAEIIATFLDLTN